MTESFGKSDRICDLVSDGAGGGFILPALDFLMCWETLVWDFSFLSGIPLLNLIILAFTVSRSSLVSASLGSMKYFYHLATGNSDDDFFHTATPAIEAW